MAGDFVALRVNGEEISLHDLLATAKFLEKTDFIDYAVRAALIRAAAAERHIEVCDRELEREADDFRLTRGLYDVKSTDQWLAAHHLAQEDWEAELENAILARKLRCALCEGRVEQYFAENKRSFDAATLACIVVEDEGVARELRAAAVEEQADFYDLARSHSTEETACRTLRRSEMDPAVGAAVFGARPGQIAGPVRGESGWHIIRVHELHPATLDEPARELIAALLFEDWLRAQRAKADVRMPVLTEI